MDKPLTMRIIRHFLGIIFFLFIQPQGIFGSWWLLSQLQVSSLGSQLLCNNIPGLVRRQRDLCQRSPDLLQSVSRGARIGVRECQHQFSRHRWNCSTIDKGSSVFGKVMLKAGSREAAFLYAISSAGVVHAVTRSCSKGEIRNCACDPNKRGVSQDSQGDFTWGGCSEYVSYGIKFSRKFVDARERRQRDARALMNLHNNRAGRRAVQKHMKMECKCHGVSGSCASRTCWLALKEFREVGRYLKKRYDIAVQTAMNQPGQLVPVQTQKGVSRNDLVYFEPSPDYCVTNTDTGSWGTAGRECNKTSKGTDGCDIMCCGRGYDTKRVLVTTKCRCKFHWCCYVKCDECKEWKDIHTCKAATEN